MARSALRRTLGAVVALVAIGVTASASASTGAIIEPAGGISATASAVTFQSGMTSVICPMTLNGSLEEGPLLVETGATFGAITEVAVARCTNGTFGSALALPWTVRLDGALGTLPEGATGLQLTMPRAAVAFTQFGAAMGCLYAGEVDLLLGLRTGDPHTTTSMSVLREPALPRAGGGGLCPLSVATTGGFTVTQQAVGMGTAPLFASPREWSFGEVEIGVTARKTVRLANMTDEDVTVPLNEVEVSNAVFGAASNFTVRPGRSSPTVISFTPRSPPQGYTGTIGWKDGEGTVIWRMSVRGTGR